MSGNFLHNCTICGKTQPRTEFRWIRDGNGGHRSSTCRSCGQDVAKWNRILGQQGLSMNRGAPATKRRKYTRST